MDIQAFIFLENEQKHVNITEQDRIQVYIQQKEDWLEDGFLNLDGTISFTQNGIMQGADHSDELAPLWQYYADALKNCLEDGSATFYYPNIPIEVCFKKISENRFSLTIDQEEAVYDTSDFIQAFKQAALSFHQLVEIISDKKYEDDLLEKIESLSQ
ncbi:hypothetical protein EXW93_01525 [Exiguobacterium sp. JMULE1]|uniref:hypothetical protein n=1 Tax=Exiguobacterium sp. JMULE1 TaxID=2518339 RepID=UPI0015754BD8|nr:hypothetical protein [Exiguobacterium sp. JMULE1]NTY08288.1 hypothetical protein [Exiguobacterium sp. JMULE1]